MNVDDLMGHLLHDSDHFDQYARLLRDWPGDEVQEYVESRKAAADAHWNSNPAVSLAYADEIIGIGCIRAETCYVALGMMARGDAIKLMGRVEEAWNTLELAGELYLTIGDEVGWGRTRIGRLSVCADLNRVDEALADAETARAIFERHGEAVRALRLDINIAYCYLQIGEYQRALTRFQQALDTALSWGERGSEYLGMLYTNLGFTFAKLGDLRQAAAYHERAFDAYSGRGETLRVATAKSNLANLAILQGRYRHALNCLHDAGTLSTDEYPVEHLVARRLLIACYLTLNRYAEAREQALDLIARSRQMGIMNETGDALMSLATAEAEMGHFSPALRALDDAEAIFTFVDAPSWVASVRLRRGQVALKQGDWLRAGQAAAGVAEYFQTAGEQVNLASAVLLQGQAAAAQHNWPAAARTARDVLKTARRCSLPWLRYSSHLLFGQVAEAQGHRSQAARHYRAAARTVERMQRDLTITLRPGFLGSKEEALRRLIGLYLEENNAACAWQTLERAKSQILLNHLVNRDNLRWLPDNPRAGPLIENLERLRQDHAVYYQQAYETPRDGQPALSQLSRQEARGRLADCERQIRSITEQLYLLNENEGTPAVPSASLPAIQQQMEADWALVEYYNDSRSLWAFVVDRHDVRVQQLPLDRREFGRALREFEFDREAAQVICAHKGGASLEARDHLPVILDDLQRLYAGLIEPIAPLLQHKRRVIVVPYGALHYLPFHLLHSGDQYLIEQFEMVVMPAAGLLLADAPHRPPGALVLADDWEGRLPQTLSEGQMVRQLLGGDLHCNQDARRQTLSAAPRQVLHIAAHGKYRMDEPDLSYIHLSDGQMLSDDLFQHDLSYELVTLSACETGRATAVSGDELIGLGRGFLYAGAGALIASLWRIEDQLTLEWMNRLYTGLQNGLSKAAALQQAQLALLADMPVPHPIFWGAFQLVGNAGPLS